MASYSKSGAEPGKENECPQCGAKTEAPAETVQAEEKKIPANGYRIAVIALLILAVMAIIRGVTVIANCESGVENLVLRTAENRTFYYSGRLAVVRAAYGISMVVMGFLLCGICAWLRARLKGGAVLLGAFFAVSFILYLVYRFFLHQAHEDLEIFDAVAWINMICTLALMGAGCWFFGFRKEQKQTEP